METRKRVQTEAGRDDEEAITLTMRRHWKSIAPLEGLHIEIYSLGG
jgi:hypothetical protein